MKPKTAKMGKQFDEAETSKQPGKVWMPKNLINEIMQETSGLCSMQPKFYDRQCEYLAAKLKVAVERGDEFLELVKSEYETSFTPDEREEFLEVMKVLHAFVIEAKSIIEECCEDAWIQAAVKLGNVSECISSIGFNLEVCARVFSDSRKWGGSENSGLLIELVDRVYEEEVEIVREKAVFDSDDLIKKLNEELKSLLLTVRALLHISRSCPVEDLNKMNDDSLIVKVQSTKKQLTNVQLTKVQSTKIHDLSSIISSALGDISLDKVALLRELESELQSLIEKEDELKISSTAPLIGKVEDQLGLISLLFKRLEQIPASGTRGSVPNEYVLKNSSRLKGSGEFLGKGSYGRVYKAVYAGLEVAKKIILYAPSSRCEKEVSILARMCHPNVSSLICYARDEEEQTIVTRFMDKDLSSLIREQVELRKKKGKGRENERKRKGKEKKAEGEGDFLFPMLIEVDIMLQVAAGMNYVHGLEIGHRDLKPDNILVRKVRKSEYVLVEITDFGESKVKEMSTADMTPNIGSLRWKAPELIEDTGAKSEEKVSFREAFMKVAKCDFHSFAMVCCELLIRCVAFMTLNKGITRDMAPKLEAGAKREKMLYGEVFLKVAKCDVHSFAMVCYELLTGYVPFKGILPTEFKEMILQGKRPDLPDRCPKRLKNLIKRCWSSKPNERPWFGDICKELRCLKYELLFTCAWGKIPPSVYYHIGPPTKQDLSTPSTKQDYFAPSTKRDDDHPFGQVLIFILTPIFFCLYLHRIMHLLLFKPFITISISISIIISAYISAYVSAYIIMKVEPYVKVLMGYPIVRIHKEDLIPPSIVEEDISEDYFTPIADNSTRSKRSLRSEISQNFSEENGVYFEELKRRQSLRISQNIHFDSGGNVIGFLQDMNDLVVDMNDLVVGKKIGKGGEAEIFEAGERYVVKVFRHDFPLQELEDSLPLGLLNAFNRDPVQESPLSLILGATLLKEERFFNRFAIVRHKKWGDLRRLIDLGTIKDTSYLSSPFTIDQVLKMMFGIAKDMMSLHSQSPKILHRDLKASNVLVQGSQLPSLDGGFEVTVCDFELSNGVFGTGFWRAPEILDGMMMRVGSSKLRKCFTEKSDVYSYSMTCYELVTGCNPFQNRKKSYSNYRKVIDGERPFLPESVPHVAIELIQKCWHPKPSERPNFHWIVDYLKSQGADKHFRV